MEIQTIFYFAEAGNTIMFLIPILAFIYFRKTDSINKKGVSLVLVTLVSSYVLSSVLISTLQIFTVQEVSCVVLIITLHTCTPLFIYAYLTRAMNYVYQQARIKQALQTPSSERLKITFIERLSCKYFSIYRRIESRLFTLKSSQNGSRQFLLSNIPTIGIERENSNFVLLLSILPIIAISLVSLVFPFTFFSDYFVNMASCPHAFGLVFVPIELISVFGLIFVPFSIYFISKYKDGLSLKYEMSITLVLEMPIFAVYVILDSIDNDDFITINDTIFIILICYLCLFITVIYPVGVILWKKTKKAGDWTIYESYMKDKRTFGEIKLVMAAEFCIENALFIEEYEQLKLLKGKVFGGSSNMLDCNRILNDQDIRSGVRKMYNKFVVEGSVLQLNLSSEVVSCAAKDVINYDYGLECLDPILKEVHYMVYSNTYRRHIACTKVLDINSRR